MSHSHEGISQQTQKHHYFSSVAQSCLTLCNPMDCSTPGFPVHHQTELAQTHVHSWWCHPTISSSVVLFSSCLQSFPGLESLPMSPFFTLGGQSTGASASVLPMNIQDWFPLTLTGLISLQSKELSRVFSSTTVQKHQFFSAHPSLDFNPREVKIYPYRDLNINVHNSYICKNPKLETIQMPINR